MLHPFFFFRPALRRIFDAMADALTRLKPAEAAAEVAKALGLPRRDLYRRAMELKGR